ncbi:hypothetical protein FB639_005073, partial [Coemansia asiatica]
QLVDCRKAFWPGCTLRFLALVPVSVPALPRLLAGWVPRGHVYQTLELARLFLLSLLWRTLHTPVVVKRSASTGPGPQLCYCAPSPGWRTPHLLSACLTRVCLRGFGPLPVYCSCAWD